MKRDPGDYLADILAALDEAAEFTAGMSFAAFARDRKTVNAVVRSLEVLGEAAKRIPDDLRAEAPAVPWKYMAGMRDKLIHSYFGVDLRIVWSAVRDELPRLRPEIVRLLDQAMAGSPRGRLVALLQRKVGWNRENGRDRHSYASIDSALLYLLVKRVPLTLEAIAKESSRRHGKAVSLGRVRPHLGNRESNALNKWLLPESLEVFRREGRLFLRDLLTKESCAL